MDIRILAQPDDVTCGPTSLHAVYSYYGYQIPLEELIRDMEFLEEGGTLAVFLGLDALRRGFCARLYTYNLKVFDPTWATLAMPELRKKLQARLEAKKNGKLRTALRAYIRFLDHGGQILFKPLTTQLFTKYFKKGIPVLSGLSATYLYGCMREYTNALDQSVFDDIEGDPMGHFVVLYGFNENKRFLVADPDHRNPISGDPYYQVDSRRLIHSILLGIITYDSNMLVVFPKDHEKDHHRQ
jgi:hypothetical protein